MYSRESFSSSEGGAAATQADVGGDETVSEEVSKHVFSSYVCQGLASGLGIDHPGEISEASSLSAISLPPSSYPLWDALPEDIVNSGKLSRLQLEGVLFACSKHQEVLHDSQRAGFFIGDGAGVGKGRQICGIIIDNYARGRKQSVWISTSSDLHHEAERDMRDLGCNIKIINNCQTLDKEQRAFGLSKDFKEGVLFSTYNTLVSGTKKASRLQQVVDWCGGASFEGCVVFDECHKAKNFVPGSESQSTKMAACVIQLQQLLPRARIVYCSATGVSEIGNMAYMARMGFWGAGTAFKDCAAFMDSMKKRGIGFLEMLAMEMKSEGKYVSRGLGFSGTEFVERECALTPEQTAMYDSAVALWCQLRKALTMAQLYTKDGSGQVWKIYWATQQRFFKILSVSIKVPTVIAEAQAALAEGCCVVIGLQSTGEAATDRSEAEAQPGGAARQFVSATRDMLQYFVLDHFPTLVPIEPVGEAGPHAVGPKDSGDQFCHHPECVAARDALLEAIAAMELPVNFLDDIIDKLGGPSMVAEMTGRKGRMVRTESGHGACYELRGRADTGELDSCNVAERHLFMKGKKLVAIVSDAASTGISLHADKCAENQRRRVHLTVELPWSADKAIQQLGRSHRSNQSSGPIYKLLSTNLGGEKRFAAAVARRLQSLGALTRGDRRAASGADLSASNFDTPLGRRALRRMYDAVVQEEDTLAFGVSLGDLESGAEIRSIAGFHASLRAGCSMMGVGVGSKDPADSDEVEGGGGSMGTKDLGDVKRFLNRILGLPVAQQNQIFSYFAAVLAAEVRAAKSEGKYSEGVSDLPASSLQEEGAPKVLFENPWSGMKTMQHTVTMDRGMSFTAACERLEREQAAATHRHDGFWRSKREMWGNHMYLLAVQKVGQKHVFSVCRPNTGQSFFEMDREELQHKYKQVTREDAEQGWNLLYDLAQDSCMHGALCPRGPSCQVGRRMTTCTILTGSVVPIWATLEKVLERHEGMLSKSDRSMRAVRAELDNSGRLVGIRYPADLLPEVQKLLEERQAGDFQNAACCRIVEPVTLVDARAYEKMLRQARTLHDFFSKPKEQGGVDGGREKKRGAETAPSRGASAGSGGGGSGASVKRARAGGSDGHEQGSSRRDEARGGGGQGTSGRYIGPFMFPSPVPAAGGARQTTGYRLGDSSAFAQGLSAMPKPAP
ncbi:hypothetical protein CYMTET_5621 [Cymbomonas tetramitiformis]|uniref:Uncharacterized protein n=1 Tax=Cymbomonas tetramitiformis TaxID=36881 RepID=A0AAE0LIW0_9CHLO|nr:hypothetical protein CYMTET_5621 [Cymbomonas tetramitiformis]